MLSGLTSWPAMRGALALLGGAIIGPQHAGRRAAPRPPRLGERPHVAARRPRPQPEQQPRRLLQGEVAGRPGVRMTEAEQQVDVGRPGPDAVDGDQAPMRFVGRQSGERREIELAPLDRARDRLEGANLGRRQAGARQLGGAGAPHRLGTRTDRTRLRAAPRSPWRSRSRAAGRPRWRPSPANPSGRRRSGGRPAAASASRQRGSVAISACDRLIEIGLGVNVERHARSIYKCAAGATVFSACMLPMIADRR